MSGILLFSLFMLTWIPINFICLFKKDMSWEPIKHKRGMGIDEVKKQFNLLKKNQNKNGEVL